MNFILLIVIFFSSFILTMVGLGGGLVYSSLFILLDFPKEMAVAASLFLNGIAAASAAIIYVRKKMVDFSVSVPLIVTSSLGAPLGALTTHWVNTEIFVMIMALVIFLAGLMMLSSIQVQSKATEVSQRKRILGGGLIGLVIGFFAGLLGVGGGVFVVPLLIFLLKIPAKTAAASSIFIVCFSSLSGFITYASMGTIDWKFVLWGAMFSFTGGQIGSRVMAGRLQGKTIHIIFSIVLFVLSVKLFHRVLM